MNVNKVFIGGHLTRPPELQYTPKGRAVAKIGVAVNRKWKTEVGEEKQEVTFLDCTAWGRTAETMTKHLGTGSPVFIEGRLRLEQWEKDGQRRQAIRVIVESFQFVGAKSDSAAVTEPGPDTPGASQEKDDEIPF